MDNGPAKTFLKHLSEHSDEREALKGAVLEEIVAAGKAAGYHFSKGDLQKALEVKSDLSMFGWSN